MEISDREVISIMVSGGRQVCDQAIEKWCSGRYDFPTENAEQNHNRRHEHQQRWKAIRERIGEIAKQLKEKA